MFHNSSPITLIFLFILSASCANEQAEHAEIDPQNYTQEIPFGVRGLSTNDTLAILGATNGMVGFWNLNTNNVTWTQPDPENDTAQFRSTAITDEGKVYAINAGSPMQIWSTSISDVNWKKIYQYSHPSVFVDGLVKVGNTIYGYGDPIHDSLFLFKLDQNGFQQLTSIPMAKGEAGFAASNSGMAFNNGKLFIATGGTQSRLLQYDLESGDWNTYSTNFQKGEGKGIFAVDVEQNQVALVGGSYMDAANVDSTSAYAEIQENGGLVWRSTDSLFLPYCSDVEILSNGNWIATGRSGVQLVQNGVSMQLDTTKFYAVEETNSKFIFTGKDRILSIPK